MDKHVGNVIGNSYKLWKKGDDIAITCPTGSGKTYFVLNILAKQSERQILYLYNRINLGRQLKMDLLKKIEGDELSLEEIDELSEIGNIYFLSYQRLAAMIQRGETVNTGAFSYLIMDEVHFLLADAYFNNGVVAVLKWIEKGNNSIRLWVTATSEGLMKFLEEKYQPNFIEDTLLLEERIQSIINGTESMLNGCEPYLKIYKRYDFSSIVKYGQVIRFWQYTLPCDYSYIAKVSVFNSVADLLRIINELPVKEKKLIFVTSIKQATRMAEQMGEHSVLNLNAERIRDDPQIIAQIIRDNNFSQEICITTKVMDNGINLQDIQIKHIFMCNILDQTDFVQMLGRRRKMGDSVNLYLQDMKSEELEKIYQQSELQSRVALLESEKVPDFLLNGFPHSRFVKKFWQWNGGKGSYENNELAAWKIVHETHLLSEMLQEHRSLAAVQRSWLHMDNEEILSEEKNESVDLIKLCNFLSGYLDVKMDKQEQEKFRKGIGEMALLQKNPSYRSDRVFGLKLINDILDAENIPYLIESHQEKRKTVWEVFEKDESLGC